MNSIDGIPFGDNNPDAQPYADDSQRADYQPSFSDTTGGSAAAQPPVSKTSEWIRIPDVNPAATRTDTTGNDETGQTWSSILNAIYRGPEYLRSLTSGVASDPAVLDAVKDYSTMLAAPKAYGTKLGATVASKVANSILGEISDSISAAGTLLSHKGPGAVVNTMNTPGNTTTPWNVTSGQPVKLVDVVFEDDEHPKKIAAPPQYNVNSTVPNKVEDWFPRTVLEVDKDKKPVLSSSGVGNPRFSGMPGGNVYSGVTGRLPRSSANLNLHSEDRDRILPAMRRDIDASTALQLANYIFSTIEGHLNTLDASTRFQVDTLIALQLLRSAANSLSTGRVSGKALASLVFTMRSEGITPEIRGVSNLIQSLMGVVPGPVSGYTSPLLRDAKNSEAKESLALAHNALMHAQNGNTTSPAHSPTIIRRRISRPEGSEIYDDTGDEKMPYGSAPDHIVDSSSVGSDLSLREAPSSGSVDMGQFQDNSYFLSRGSRTMVDNSDILTHHNEYELHRFDKLKRWEEFLGSPELMRYQREMIVRGVTWFHRPLVEDLFLESGVMVIEGSYRIVSIHFRTPDFAMPVGGLATGRRSYLSQTVPGWADVTTYPRHDDEEAVTTRAYPLVQQQLVSLVMCLTSLLRASSGLGVGATLYNSIPMDEICQSHRTNWSHYPIRFSPSILRRCLDMLCAIELRSISSRRKKLPIGFNSSPFCSGTIGLDVSRSHDARSQPFDMAKVLSFGTSMSVCEITVQGSTHLLIVIARSLIPTSTNYALDDAFNVLSGHGDLLSSAVSSYDGEYVALYFPTSGLDPTPGDEVDELLGAIAYMDSGELSLAISMGRYMCSVSFMGQVCYGVLREMSMRRFTSSVAYDLHSTATVLLLADPEIVSRAIRNRLMHALNGNIDGFSSYLARMRNKLMHALNGNTTSMDNPVLAMSETQIQQNASSPMETSIAGIFSAEADANIVAAIAASNDMATPARGYVAQINDQITNTPLISMAGGGGPPTHVHFVGHTLCQRSFSTVGDGGGVYPYAQINKLHTVVGPEVEMTAAFAQAYQTKVGATGDFPSLLRLNVTQVSGAKYLMYAQMVGDMVANSKNTSTALVITRLLMYLQTMSCYDIASNGTSEQGAILIPPTAGDPNYAQGWDPDKPRIFPSYDRSAVPQSAACYWRPYQTQLQRLDNIVAPNMFLPCWTCTFGDYITWLGNGQAPTAAIPNTITPQNLGYALGNWAVVPVPNVMANCSSALFWWVLAHLEYPFMEIRGATTLYDQFNAAPAVSSGSANLFANCCRIPGTIVGVIIVIVDDYGASGPNMMPMTPGNVNIGWNNSMWNPAGAAIDLLPMFQGFSSFDAATSYVTNAFIGNPKNPIQDIWTAICFWDQFCGNTNDWNTAKMIATEFARAYPQQMRNYGQISPVVGMDNYVFGASYQNPGIGTGEEQVGFRQGTVGYHTAFMENMISTASGVTITKWNSWWYLHGLAMYMIPDVNADIYLGLVSNMYHCRNRLSEDQLIDPYNHMRRTNFASIRLAMAVDLYSIGAGVTWSVALFPSSNPVGPSSTTQAVGAAWNAQCHQMALRVFPGSMAVRINGTRTTGKPPGATEPVHVFNGSIAVGPPYDTDAAGRLYDSSYFYRIPMELWHYMGVSGAVLFSEADEVKAAYPSYDYNTSCVTPDGPLMVYGGQCFIGADLSKRVSSVSWKALARWVARNSTFGGQYWGAPNTVPNLRHNRLWNSKNGVDVLTVSSRTLVDPVTSVAPSVFVGRTNANGGSLPRDAAAPTGVQIFMVSSPSGMPPPPIAWNRQAGVGRYALAVNQYELLQRMAVGLPYYSQDSGTDPFTTASDTNTLFTNEAVSFVGGHYIFRSA